MPRAKKETAPPQPTPMPFTFNFMNILLIIVALLSLYLLYKVHTLEQRLTSGSPSVAGQQAAASPLSVDNLKKYAKDLGLNSGQFNQCLDSNSKAAAITADTNYGSSVGVQGTPGFFINGRFLGGAFPFQFFKEIIDKEIAGQGSDNCTDYSADLQKYCSDPNNKAFDPVAKKIEVGTVPGEGASNPKVAIVEFSDFQCPYCIRAEATVDQVMKTYGNDVKLYYRQYPLVQIHPFAQKAAEASLCAADQGKFWPYHDKLFGVQQTQ